MHKLIINDFVGRSSIFKSDSRTPHLTMTRTFHPVGQGAFYSEVFKVNEVVKFVVVYDCGTESNKKSFKKVISAFKAILPDNHKIIDILFLSHLHKDHINGLDELMSGVTVKKTVIPLLPADIVVLTRVKNALEERSASGVESNDSIMEDLYYSGGHSDRFGEIVAIPPFGDFDHQYESLPRNATFDKESIPISEDKPFWEYVPMNSILGNDQRAIDFGKAIRGIAGVFDAYGRLDTSQLVRGKRTVLRKAYSKAMKKANDNLYTLVVNSKPVDERVDDEILARESRCLYTGDLDTQKNKKDKLLERVMQKFPIDDIGVFQVPHHGSKENWQDEFLGKTPRDYVVSVGKNNGHHHPDFWAMEKIRDVKENGFHIVTEDIKDQWFKEHTLFF